MTNKQINKLVDDIYDSRIEKCDSQYREAMTRLYIGLALEEGFRRGRLCDGVKGKKGEKEIGRVGERESGRN